MRSGDFMLDNETPLHAWRFEDHLAAMDETTRQTMEESRTWARATATREAREEVHRRGYAWAEAEWADVKNNLRNKRGPDTAALWSYLQELAPEVRYYEHNAPSDAVLEAAELAPEVWGE